MALMWIIFGAPSCSESGGARERYEQKHIAESVDSIKQMFEVDIPDAWMLNAYEETAGQKLSDFADYLKIASDSTKDMIFRTQAAEMAGKLFISGDINIRNWNKSYPDNTINTLKELLAKSLSQGMSSWLQPYEINVSLPLNQQNDSSFKGRLSFYLTSINYLNPDQTTPNAGKLEIDFYALRKVKPFGETKLKVWEVYLGDIN
jgi:hypothetical protein